MNKDETVLSFRVLKRDEIFDNVTFEIVKTEREEMLPIGFTGINAWLKNRKASAHSTRMRALMIRLGCENNEDYIRKTRAASINDTFWVKSDDDNVDWNDVSLYSNPFDGCISQLAFEGKCICSEVSSAMSPELSCEGSYGKRFLRIRNGKGDEEIHLCKRGGHSGNGFEPYCEVMASEIARHISPDAVSYRFKVLSDTLASRCRLFTDEKNGFAPFRKIKETADIDAFDYFYEIGSEQAFREMLVIDSLCFNEDRHSGNYGVLFDNDTLKVIKMSPVFDLNASLFSNISTEDFANIGEILCGRQPKLGEDFTRMGQTAINDIIRDRIKDMKDFSFSFRGDDVFPEKRVKAIEEVVRRQAAAILSQDKLYTKNVFFTIVDCKPV